MTSERFTFTQGRTALKLAITDTASGRPFFESARLYASQLKELATLLNQLDALGRADAELRETCTRFEAGAS